MNTQKSNWLIIGTSKNWETSLSQPIPIWGLKTTFKSEFQRLNPGDMVWFYATAPVQGIIGLGIIRDKYIEENNLLWNEEIAEKKIIWPLRFRFQVLKMMDRESWEQHNIKINDFNIYWQRGFHLLKDEYVTELETRATNIFGSQDKLFRGPTIMEAKVVREPQATYPTNNEIEETNITHRGLQEAIAEIGKLQYYHSQLEYSIELPGEDKNLDVVWKREISGAPTFAFEVELSGVIEKAVARLRFAYNRWNSRPRMIVPQNYLQKVNNIMDAEDRTFSEQFRMYEPNKIIELLTRKRKLKALEQTLEIY